MTTPTQQFVTYYRVSTQRQGVSGLGLDAQRQTVAQYLAGGTRLTVGEFVEVETGRDQKLRDEFAQVYVKLQRLPSLEEAVLFVITNSGYNPEHLEAMRQASVDDFYALLMKPREDVKLTSIVKWLMRWKGTENAVITDKAREALEKIKAINLLNHVRVSRYGI